MVINPQNPPSVTYPSPYEWPETILPITGLTKDAQTKVTVMNHGFTSANVGITTIDFLQVKGMFQINGRPGLILSIIDANNFTVNIDSTNFYSYTGGGVISIVTGQPPIESLSFQTFNTPFHNIL